MPDGVSSSSKSHASSSRYCFQSCRRRHQDPIADELLESHLAVDQNTQLGRLVRLSEERHLIDRELCMTIAVDIARLHDERVDAAHLGTREARQQIVLAVLVHQEPDRAPIHSINRDAIVEVLVQRLQHEAIAAQRHDGIGRLRRHVAILLRQPRQSMLRFRMVARDEGDLLEVSC